MRPAELHIRVPGGAEIRLGIENGRFAAAGERGPVLDLRHLVALAGLADCHAHIGATSIGEMTASPRAVRATMTTNITAQLSGGVLLVADKGARDPMTLEALRLPPEQRPELHMAGRMIAAPGGYYDDFAVEVDGPDLPAAVEAACLDGASWVKLVGDWPRRGRGAVPNYAEPELRSAVQVAHGLGRRVAIHTAAPDTPAMAVAAGIDSIEHGLFLTESDLAALGDRGGAWVPTLLAMEGLAEQLKDGSSGRRLLNEGVANARRLLPSAVASGVAVLAGTDLHLPHGEVAREVVALGNAGLTTTQALACATEAAARFLRSDRGLVPGAVADLVGFRSDPLDDLTTLLDPAVVLRCGRWIHAEEER